MAWPLKENIPFSISTEVDVGNWLQQLQLKSKNMGQVLFMQWSSAQCTQTSPYSQLPSTLPKLPYWKPDNIAQINQWWLNVWHTSLNIWLPYEQKPISMCIIIIQCILLECRRIMLVGVFGILNSACTDTLSLVSAHKFIHLLYEHASIDHGKWSCSLPLCLHVQAPGLLGLNSW